MGENDAFLNSRTRLRLRCAKIFAVFSEVDDGFTDDQVHGSH